MKRPSERALDLADEILDHVHHGLTRVDALYELADMIDESNGELLRAVRSALRDAERNGGLPSPEVLAQLPDTVRDYLPVHQTTAAQRDLFVGQPARLF